MIAGVLFGRSGSSGLPGKNEGKLLGRYIFEYPLLAAAQSGCIDRLFVSTDSPRIAEISAQHGAKHIARPPELCTSAAPLADAIAHALAHVRNMESDVTALAVFLCNAPNVTPRVVRTAVDKLEANPTLDSVVTVCSYPMFSPIRARKDDGAGCLVPYVPLEHFAFPVSSDRKAAPQALFVDSGLTLVRAHVLDRMQDNLPPFRWMGSRIGYVEQPAGGGDIDEPWQLPVLEWWLRTWTEDGRTS